MGFCKPIQRLAVFFQVKVSSCTFAAAVQVELAVVLSVGMAGPESVRRQFEALLSMLRDAVLIFGSLVEQWSSPELLGL